MDVSHATSSSRKYRPQIFADIKGQDPIITVLKNAIIHHRTVQAYLFSGIRGTGKTTLARVFAKALNCLSPQDDVEPCNLCSVCQEITSGVSLDFIEIDGASHRGIDDIRQINETLAFAPIKTKYKIYLIDEVHMLTKEAFNSLLKSLEEPPYHVKFFLATTEIHKIPETILSRCQKIHLNRLSNQLIVEKLQAISKNNNLVISEEALQPIARMAQGSLRDAESLYDYVTNLFLDDLSADKVSEALGFTPTHQLSNLAKDILDKKYDQALAPVAKIIESGVPPITFLHDLTQFYLDLLIHHNDTQSPLYALSQRYASYTLLEIIEFLGEAAKHLQNSLFEKIFLETVIVRIIQLSHSRSPSAMSAPFPQSKSNTRSSDSTTTSSQVKPIAQNTSSILQEKPPVQDTSTILQKKAIPESPSALLYKEQSLFPNQVNQEVVFIPIQTQTQQTLDNIPSKMQSAALDTLLQFASVEFSGTLTKEI